MNTLQLDGLTSVRWADPAALTAHESRARRLLSADERRRYDGTISASARERLLWGRFLLRELVATRIGVRAADVTIDARCDDCGGAHGRPVLTGPDETARALSVSVSACAGMVVVATSLRRSIGIDVEPRSGATERLQAIRDVAGEADDPLRHWTRVEAVLKADGRGLRVDPGRVRIDGDGADVDGVRYRLAEPAIDPRFVINVAFDAASVAAREAERG